MRRYILHDGLELTACHRLRDGHVDCDVTKVNDFNPHVRLRINFPNPAAARNSIGNSVLLNCSIYCLLFLEHHPSSSLFVSLIKWVTRNSWNTQLLYSYPIRNPYRSHPMHLPDFHSLCSELRYTVKYEIKGQQVIRQIQHRVRVYYPSKEPATVRVELRSRFAIRI